MTAYAPTLLRPRSPRPLLLLLLTLLLALAAAIVAGGIRNHRHAVERHGLAEVSQIRQRCQTPGPEQVFKKHQDDRYFLLCRLDDGRYGVQIVDADGDEITSFVPHDGSLARVLQYLRQQGTPFKGPLPWA